MSVEMPPTPGPEVEQHHHHHRSGHGWLDITLGVSAVFISLMSLFLAIQHGRVMEKMVEASTWAFVTVVSSNIDTNYTPHTHLTIVNKGVGPATVEDVELFYQGIAQPGPHALVNAILKVKPGEKEIHGYFKSDVHGIVLSAKEEVNFLDFNVTSYSPEQYSTLAHAISTLPFRVCYCSVLHQCAVVDSRKDQGRHAAAVEACSVPATPFEEDK
jgi:hypothetical protein